LGYPAAMMTLRQIEVIRAIHCDVGHCLPGLQRGLPEFLPRALPTLFAIDSPPGSTNVPLTVGAITLAITAVAAIAAFPARETYRLPVNDLGNPCAAPMEKPDYGRLRAASFAGVAPAWPAIRPGAEPSDQDRPATPRASSTRIS